eukprot:CAMPEP_0182608870 /NCGR_PEP_ID=MMETSP1330-20130603/3158_1 /TAXON_ID=464278 /ORGANISM="Picochlorum sp., Strain RCC944" /LENGTH=53 /DNA_ID=CAMNT_0024827681 /DNA_START=186 /DNA_END=344 /DNA_ORIENTATION=+
MSAWIVVYNALGKMLGMDHLVEEYVLGVFERTQREQRRREPDDDCPSRLVAAH